MPIYQYSCNNCTNKKDKKIGLYNSDSINLKFGYHPDTNEFLFFVECHMKDKPKNPKCPNCGSNDTNVSYIDLDQQCYVRGNGLVKDKAGARRDMNRHKLKHEVPYSSMRVSGEKDYLIDKFRRGGIDMGAKSNTDSIREAQEKRLVEHNKEIDLLSDSEKKVIVHIFKNGSATTSELSKYSDDINKVLTNINKHYVYYNANKEIWLPLAGGNRIYETIVGI
jgi:hypothetical protein